jgi:UDP-N-acetylmuramate dehydrogenase
VTARLSALPDSCLRFNEPLSSHTRFGIGGPADVYFETTSATSFAEALDIATRSGLEWCVIGDGTNLVVNDAGYRGIILRLRSSAIRADGAGVHVEAGAVLQHLVDFTVARGLRGLETMTGIPGSTGAAIYGNAGAYGHSISERVTAVQFLDDGRVHEFSNEECEFRYRESIFKHNKQWIVLSATLEMTPADAGELQATSTRILDIRNKKYPPTMKCAGSIFKNFLYNQLPPAVAAQVPATSVIEGKVPSAWFLESIGAKGLRVGDIQVATYHANLIYNDGHGTSHDLIAVVCDLKQRVREKWGIEVEEEVQYVGFDTKFRHFAGTPA